MNTRTLFLRASAALGLVLLVAASTQAADSDRIVVSGFRGAESVVHDPLTDVYLVSNVGGPPVIFNHGFISRVSPQGAVLDLKWIEDGVNGATLHGPKGLWLHRAELYVVDIDTLRVFNRFTGAPIRDVPIPNPFAAPGTTPPLGTPTALFLNHVVVANDGTAYISDQLNSAIFRVDPQGNASVLASGPQLGNPDGFLLDDGEVTWVTFFGHEVRRMTSSGKIIMEAPLPAVDVSGLTLGPNPLPPGALLMDGYARWHGSLLVTSWVTGKIYRIGRSGTEIETIAQVTSSRDNPANPDGPAKINIDRSRGRLLVPLFNAGQLLILQLPD
jgi:streptogramin lyase